MSAPEEGALGRLAEFAGGGFPYRANSCPDLRCDVRGVLGMVDDMKSSVVAFAGPWAAQWAKEHGLPDGHLNPHHYDILAKAGARMDDFTRGEEK